MQSCREKTADSLASLLEDGSATLSEAAYELHRSVRYVHSIANEWPGRFVVIRLGGRVGDDIVSLSTDHD